MANRVDKKITKTVIDKLQAGEFVWDAEIKGFGCRCQKQGKVYFLKYRHGNRQRWYTIGRHGSPWTPQNARDKAIQLLADVKNNKDPALERERTRTAPTLKDLAEKFKKEHVAAKRKDRTISEYGRLLDKIIVPKLGMHNVADISRADIAKLHYSLSDTPFQANRVLAVLSKMFNLAETWGERPDGSNPCRHIERFKERRHERFLSAEELGKLGEALKKAEADYQLWQSSRDNKAPKGGADKVRIDARKLKGVELVSAEAIAAIRLLIFTGARVNEILTLQWEWIDFKRGNARLPDSKTGVKTIHLPAPALEVLSGLKRVEDNPYVLIGQKAKKNLVNLEKPWQIIRKMAGLADVRLHDLRHSFASTAAASGMSLPLIGKMLGHSQAQTTQRYAHLSNDPVKTATDKIATKIAHSLSGKDKIQIKFPNKVVSL
jgi:integrase